jgi:TonB family protein
MTALAPEQNLSKNFIVSLVGHLAICLLAYGSGQLISKVFKNNDIEVIRSSVRVDVVGMPKFTVQELKALEREPMKPAEPEEVKGVKEETVVKTEVQDVIKKDDLVIEEKGNEKTKKSFLNILNDYSSKKVTAKENKKGTKAGKSNKNLDALILEGNRLSQGSALTGDYSDEQNSEFAGYVQALPGKIRQFWKLPSFLLNTDHKCRIRVYLSTSGGLVNLEVVEPSGKEEFDARAIKAIRDAAPFPKPSDEVGARLTNSGIILGFPL